MDFGIPKSKIRFGSLDFEIICDSKIQNQCSGFWILEIQNPNSDFGFWILEVENPKSDTGFWILDFGIQNPISDAGFWISESNLR